MKKIKLLSLIAMFALIFTLVPSFTYAATMPEVNVKVSKTNLTRGEEFTAVVSLNTNSVSDITGLQFKLKYDSNILEVVEEPVRNLPAQSSELGMTGNNTENSSSDFAWTTYGTTGLDYDGDVYTTKFKVKEDAAIGNSELTIDVSEANYPIQNSVANTKIESTINNSSINVVVPLNSISFGKTTQELNVGENDTLTVTYDPEDTTDNKVITWTNSNEEVVTVKNGVVTAIGRGTARIIATVGTKTAECTYTVKAPLKSISIGENIELIKNQTKTLSVTYNPEDTTDDKTVTWKSSDDSVATVDSNGKIKAIKAGTADITATVGAIVDTIKVTVVEIPINTISINELDDTLYRGEKVKFTITYNPENTTDDKTVTWESSDSKIATVDSEGNVEAIKEGTVTITAKVGTKTATRELTVKEKHLESAKLFKEDADKLVVGAEIPVWVVLNPEDTTDKLTFEWTSSDEDIATVDEYGNVTGVKEGTVTITVKITTEYDEEIEATIDLKVEAKSVVDDTTNDVTNDTTSGTTNDTTESTTSPQTGDLPILLITIVGIAALVSSVIIVKKKLIKE